MDQPLVSVRSSRGCVPPGPDRPILFLPADAAAEQGGYPFVVIVKSRRNSDDGLAIRPPAYSGSKSTACWEMPMLGSRQHKAD
jgi:hypothetical protein